MLAPSCAVDDVAVLGFPIARVCDRHMNFTPDDLMPIPIASSDGFPPLRNTK